MNWRTTVWLTFSFAGVVGVWLVWRPPAEEQRRLEMLFPWREDQYSRIEIQPAGKPEIILERSAPQGRNPWRITKPIDRPAWAPYVMDAVGGLRALKNDGVIPPGKPAYDPALAGGEKPDLVLRLTVGGERRTVKFGRPLVNDPSLRWFMIEGDLNLRFGSTAAYDACLRSVAEMRHHGVVFVEDPGRIVKVEVHERVQRGAEGYDASEFQFRQERGGRGWWYWVKTNDLKVEERLDDVRVKNFLSDVCNLMAEDFVETNEPARYGLDKPVAKYRLWLRDAARPVGILVGKSEKAGDKMLTYLQEEGSTEVALVKQDEIRPLPLKKDEFRSKSVCDFARDDVKSIELANDLGRVRIERTRKKEGDREVEGWAVAEPAGLAVREDQLLAFVEGLLRLQIKDFLGLQTDRRTFGLDPAGVTARFVLGRADGPDESRVYSFGFKGNSETYLTRPGTAEVFSVPEGVCQKLDLLDLNFRDPRMMEIPRASIIGISASIEDEIEPGKASYFWVEKKADGTWAFRDTANKGVVDQEKLGLVLGVVSWIEAKGFISRRAEVRKDYGLEGNNSAGKLEVFYEEGGERRRYGLRISRFLLARGADERAWYGILEGDPTIFRIDPFLVETLRKGVLKSPDEKPR